MPKNKTFYIATCLGCHPILPQPFSSESERDKWADAHTEGTRHAVARYVEAHRV